ncbi:uncharacterized protein KD926_010531 [Aspergillus affinis]|uniref:uncharacterized protein n=1 Tax=Aspergillus affinis TaxID=1070780 RepID=UPI0022FDC90C|nr:uncharacterized protein KD926_010531 [Aspergillus affinis]KAI9038691.1 hypothetical protein KD926_010531 [Aspergillus affinis]
MPAIVTSDFAAASDGSTIWVYYQNDANELREVTSSDGSKWTETSSAVADKLNAGGSPITAYYIKNDGTAGGKPAIHVIYIDASGILHEVVKTPLDNQKWEARKLSDDIKKAPIQTSRLASGVCHDTAPGAHQWIFFEKLDSESGIPQIAELRSGSESSFKWVYQTILPEKPASALPGTQLATNITDPANRLFFQDHNGDVAEYIGGYDSWNGTDPLSPFSFPAFSSLSPPKSSPVPSHPTQPLRKPNNTAADHAEILTNDKVEINTPISAAESSVPEKPYVFYVSKSTPLMMMCYDHDKSTEVGKYYPGTKIDAITVGKKVLLFHKPLEHPGSVWTRVFDGSEWKMGAQVVGA